jgi:hypothetical protein
MVTTLALRVCVACLDPDAYPFLREVHDYEIAPSMALNVAAIRLTGERSTSPQRSTSRTMQTVSSHRPPAHG